MIKKKRYRIRKETMKSVLILTLWKS